MASKIIASYGIEFTGDTSKVKRAAAEVDAAVQGVGKSAGTAGKSVERFGLNLDRAATRLGSITRLGGTAGNILSLGVSAGFAGASIAAVGFGVAMQKAITAGIDFESAFAGVVKTVDASDAVLAEIRQSFIDLSLEIPQSAVALAQIGEVAGQLGVEAQNITAFTATVADLGVTTNLSTTDAATGLARLINITEGSFDTIENLGSALVDLGNNSATTEAEILAMSLRIAGAGKQVGLTEADILGFAAALSSLGVRAEAGGSAISRTFIEIDKAVTEGGEKLADFAEVAGLSVQQFTQLWETDAAAATVAFSEGLGRISEAGGDVFGTLEQLELGEIRVRDALLRLAGSGTLAAESIGLSNDAFKEGTALSEEAAKRYETTQAKIDILKNSVRAFGIALFDEVKPGLDDTIEGLTNLVQSADGAVVAIGGIVGVLGIYIKEIGKSIEATTEFIGVLSAMGEATGADNIKEVGEETGISGRELVKWIAIANPVIGIQYGMAEGFGRLGEGIRQGNREIKQAEIEMALLKDESGELQAKIDELAARGVFLVKSFFDPYTAALVKVQRDLRENSEATTDYKISIIEQGRGLADARLAYENYRASVLASNRAALEGVAAQNLLIDVGDRVQAQRLDEHWSRVFDALQKSMQIDPSSFMNFVEQMIDGVQLGQITFEDLISTLGNLPEDIADDLIGDLQQLQVDFLEIAGSAESSAGEVRDAQSAYGILAGVIEHLLSITDDAAGGILNLASAYSHAASMIDLFSDQASDFGGVASTLEAAYDVLQDRQEKGIDLTEREQEFLERYPDLYGRAIGGQEEAIVQAGLWAAVQGELILLQDDVNKGMVIGDERVASLARAIQGIGEETGIFTEDMRLALEAILGVNVGLDGLDGQEANIAVNLLEGAGSTAGQRGGPTRFEQRAEDLGLTGRISNIGKEITSLDGSSANITATIDDTDAREGLDYIVDRIDWINTQGDIIIHTSVDTSGFDAGLTYIDEHSPRSPAEKGPLSRTPDWNYLFEGLEAAAKLWTNEALEHIRLYVSTAQDIFNTLSAEIEFAGLAADFSMSGAGMPDPAFVTDLKAFTEHITQSIGESAALFKVEFLEHAEAYASAAEAGVSLISEAVSLLADLSEVSFDLDQAKNAASLLKFLTEAIVLDIGDSAAIIEYGEGVDHPSVRGAGFTGAAEAYAESAKAAVELIGTAADLLANLADFEIDLDAARAAASQIKFLTEEIVLSIGDSAAVVTSDVDHPSARGEGFIGIAKEYAEGAKAAVELIGEGLGFLAELADYEGTFDLDATKQFASNLKFLIEHIALSIGDSAAHIAASRPEDFNEQIEAFAEAVGPSLGLMSDMVDVLGAMADLGDDFVMPSLEEIQEFTDDAVVMIRMIADGFREASIGWGVDEKGAKAGTVNAELLNFAEGADAALGTLSSVFDVLTGFSEFLQQKTFLTTDQVRDLAAWLAEQVRVIAEEFKAASEGWGKVDEALAAFSEDANNSLDLVDGAIGALFALVKWEDEDSNINIQRAADELIINMDILLQAIEQIVIEYRDRGVPAWKEFSESVDASFDMVASAADAFIKLADISRLTPKQMEIFLDNWDLTLDAIEEVAAMIEERGLTAAKATLEIAREIMDLLSEAASLMKGSDSSKGESAVGVGSGGGGGDIVQNITIDAITSFGEAIDFIEAMLDLQNDLNMEDALQFVDDIGTIIRAMVSEMGQAFNSFDPGFLSQAQTFAEIALTTAEVFEKVYEQIGNIISFQFLGPFLNEDAVEKWASWLASIARTMTQALQNALEDWIGTEGLVEQVGFFAEVADDTLSTFNKTMDTIDRIAAWGDNPPITQDQAREAGAWLASTARILTEEFIVASQEWGSVNAALAAFSEDVGKSLTLVIGTVDAVEAIRKMPKITPEQIDVFLYNLNVILSAILQFSEDISGALGSTGLPPTSSSQPLGNPIPPSAGPTPPSGSGGAGNTYNINVTAQTNASPEEISMAVVAAIDRAQMRYG